MEKLNAQQKYQISSIIIGNVMDNFDQENPLLIHDINESIACNTKIKCEITQLISSNGYEYVWDERTYQTFYILVNTKEHGIYKVTYHNLYMSGDDSYIDYIPYANKWESIIDKMNKFKAIEKKYNDLLTELEEFSFI